jgi:hypothetical protein
MRLRGRTLDKRWYSLRPNPSYPIRHVSTHRSFHPAALILWLCSRGTVRSTWRQSQEQSSFRAQTTKLRRLRYTQPLRPAEAGFCTGISRVNFTSDAKRHSREVSGTGIITIYLVLRKWREEDLSTPIRLGPTSAQVLTVIYRSFAYSALAFFRTGTSRSASLYTAKKFLGGLRPNTVMTFKT